MSTRRFIPLTLLLLSFGATTPASGQQVLCLDWDSVSQGAQNALAALGLTATTTVTTDETAFNAQLSGGSDWDLVVVDNPSNQLLLPGPLEAYVSGGGSVILNYWNADDPIFESVVRDQLGGQSQTDFFSPQTLFCWDCDHPAWTADTPLSQIPTGTDHWFDDGDEFEPLAGFTAIGGFGGGSVIPNRAGLITNAAGTTYLVGAVGDGMDPVAQGASWRNLISAALDIGGAPCFLTDLAAVDPDCSTATIELSWSVSSTPPTSIEITRDGSPVATLPGSDTSYTDTGVPDGPHTYEVSAVCGSHRPQSVFIESTSTGAVPHIVARLDLGTGAVDSATAIENALDNAGQTWIEVDSLLGAFCADASTVLWVVTGTFPDNFVLDEASGSVLQAHADAGGKIHFEGGDTWGFDTPTSFSLVDGVDGGTAEDGDDSLTTLSGLDSGVGADASGLSGVSYSQDQPTTNDYIDRISPATGDSLGSGAGALWQEGTGLYQVGVAYAGDNGARVISQSWEFGGFAGSQDALMAIELEFLLGIVAPTCLNPTNLAVAGDCETGFQTLTWTAPGMGSLALEGIEVRRNGAVIATVPGTTTQYVDMAAPDGTVMYSIRALCEGGTGSGTVSVTTEVVSTTPTDIVVRLHPGGAIDSATAIETALTNAGRTWVEVSSVTEIDCIDPGTQLWVVAGTFPDNTPLDAATGAFLRLHVEGGGPVYLESGDAWGSDAPTDFALVDGVEDGTANDGDDSFVSMDGAAGNIDLSDLTGIPYTQEQPGGDFNDQIFAATADTLGPSSTVTWRQAGGAYNTGVAYATTDPAGNVICQSWEFGGYGGDANDLMSRYLAFLAGTLPPTPGFLRGDLNSDGGVDIADAVFGLSNLFAFGPSPECRDTADANGDSNYDIADMVYILSALFVTGSPEPVAPYPGCAPAPIILGCDTPQC